jgi:acyl-CoA thioesterase
MDGIFGGYVMATAVDVVRLGGFRPQSVSLAFVSTLRAGDVDVVVDPLHRGRSSASLRIELHQGGRLRAHGTGSLVRTDADPVWEPAPEPQAEGPDDWPPYDPPHRELAYLDRLDVRGIATGSLSDGVRAWVRTRGDAGAELSSAARLALYLDVLPPGLFLAEPRPAFVPSLDLTVHFSSRVQRDDGPGSWSLVSNRTVWSSDQYCVDEATVNDREGHLVAMLRQGRQVRH